MIPFVGLPRILEYYIWIINAMFADGFDDSDDNEVLLLQSFAV